MIDLLTAWQPYEVLQRCSACSIMDTDVHICQQLSSNLVPVGAGRHAGSQSGSWELQTANWETSGGMSNPRYDDVVCTQIEDRRHTA